MAAHPVTPDCLRHFRPRGQAKPDLGGSDAQPLGDGRHAHVLRGCDFFVGLALAPRISARLWLMSIRARQCPSIVANKSSPWAAIALFLLARFRSAESRAMMARIGEGVNDGIRVAV